MSQPPRMKKGRPAPRQSPLPAILSALVVVAIFVVLGVMLASNRPGGKGGLDIWVNNLTDKEYVAAKQNIDTSGPSATIPFAHFTGIVYGGLRRLYGVRLTREF